MKAIFKDKKKLVLNYADNNEQLILKDFIKKANSGKFNIVFNRLLDINGDINGMAIELEKINDESTNIEVVEEVVEESTEETSETTEPSTPTELVEG